MDATSVSEINVRTGVRDSIFDLSRQISGEVRMVQDELSRNALITERARGDILMDVERSACSVKDAVCAGLADNKDMFIREFADVKAGLTTGFRDSQVETLKSLHQLTLQIERDHAVTLDRMAQHAGATKELVQTEHEKTRALASQIDRDRCQRELADAKLEIAFLRGKIPTRVNLEA
jgi:hypothetical protein